MKYIIILLTIFLMFISTSSYGAGEFFTWKDVSGKIHITNQRPPDGVEILEITPQTSEAAFELHRQQQIRQKQSGKENEQSAIKIQAFKARQREAVARRAAEEFKRQARDIRLTKEGTRSKKRYRTKVKRNEREALKLDKKADEMLNKADTERRFAERLEKRLDN